MHPFRSHSHSLPLSPLEEVQPNSNANNILKLSSDNSVNPSNNIITKETSQKSLETLELLLLKKTGLFSLPKALIQGCKSQIEQKNSFWVSPNLKNIAYALISLQELQNSIFIVVINTTDFEYSPHDAPLSLYHQLRILTSTAKIPVAVLKENTSDKIFSSITESIIQKSLSFLFINEVQLQDNRVKHLYTVLKQLNLVKNIGSLIFSLPPSNASSFQTQKKDLGAWAEIPRLVHIASASQQLQKKIQYDFSLGKAPARAIFGFRHKNLAFEVSFHSIIEREEALLRFCTCPKNLPAKIIAPSAVLAKKLIKRLKSANLKVLSAKEEDIDGRHSFWVSDHEIFDTSQHQPNNIVHLFLPSSLEQYASDLKEFDLSSKEMRALLWTHPDDRRLQLHQLQKDEFKIHYLEQLYLQIKNTPCTPLRANNSSAELQIKKALIFMESAGILQRNSKHQLKPSLECKTDLELHNFIHEKAKSILEIKRHDLEQIWAFARVQNCRQLSWVSHFQDEWDSYQKCGRCDVCNPAAALSIGLQTANAHQRAAAWALFQRQNWPTTEDEALRQGAFLGLSRSQSEQTLDALWRAEIIQGVGEVLSTGLELRFIRGPKANDFENKSHPKLKLLFSNTDSLHSPFSSKKTSVYVHSLRSNEQKDQQNEQELAAISQQIALRSKSGILKPVALNEKKYIHNDLQKKQSLEKTELELRNFRTHESQRREIRPFRILSNRTLSALAVSRPQNLIELKEIDGIGSKCIAKYGHALLAILKRQP